jgi:hypothetical protein
MVNLGKPTAARMYDYFLKGERNYKRDRLLGNQILQECPIIRPLAFQNRAFLVRAVRYAAQEHGIRQFIDIGSGIPTMGNVHEIAHGVDPACRIVYVDKDDEAEIEGNDILREVDGATFIRANFLEPNTVLDHSETQRLIDFSQPVALLVVALLHFIGDGPAPRAKLQSYLERLPSGSLLVASHAAIDEAHEAERRQMVATQEKYEDTEDPAQFRSRAEFAAFFEGLTILDPGITFAADWRADGPVRPEDRAARRCIYAAVGRKP